MPKLEKAGKPALMTPDGDWLIAGAVVVNVTRDGNTVVMVKNEFACLVDLEQLDNLVAAVKASVIKVAEKCRRPVIQLASQIPPDVPGFKQ